jgi:hypothetical protein
MVIGRPVWQATDSRRRSPAHLEAVKPSEPSVGGKLELTETGGAIWVPERRATRFEEMKCRGMERGRAKSIRKRTEPRLGARTEE